MSKIRHYALIWACAILAAQLPGLLNQPKSVEATNACDYMGNAISTAWNGQQARQNVGKPIGTYWDVRTKREEFMYEPGTYPGYDQQPQASSPLPAAVPTVTTGVETSAVAAPVAPSSTITVDPSYTPPAVPEVPNANNSGDFLP